MGLLHVGGRNQKKLIAMLKGQHQKESSKLPSSGMQMTGCHQAGRAVPTTRYQGSKLKIVDWIWEEVSRHDFDSIADVMGGTGTVSYRFKQAGKSVHYNDRLRFNFHIGRAIIENDNTRLTEDDIGFLIRRHDGIKYDDFVERVFDGVFYTRPENRWIDTFVGNLGTFTNRYKTSLALAALFQACIIKRPYNLFHRKNLYMRLADVRRTFGNKITWDKSFDHWFAHFARQYNGCVFDSRREALAMNRDALEMPNKMYDVVYLDPPYTSRTNTVDYLEYYHFLEGLCLYLERGSEQWNGVIDWNRKPLPMLHAKSDWNNRSELDSAFESVFKKFNSSMMVVSWNRDGSPGPSTIRNLLKKYYDKVELKSTRYKYVLSHKQSEELLLIAR